MYMDIETRIIKICKEVLDHIINIMDDIVAFIRIVDLSRENNACIN